MATTNKNPLKRIKRPPPPVDSELLRAPVPARSAKSKRALRMT